jgi:hypothetical protein
MARGKIRPVKTKLHIAEAAYQRLISHVNRKQWWHVPPVDPDAYKKRGKFLASSFAEAEFWGRPLDEPQKVTIGRPLVGDEKTISKVLGVPPQHEGMTLEEIAEHDSRWRNTALAKGFDAIVLMAPKAFAKFRANGELPRSLELNILNFSVKGKGQLTEKGRILRICSSAPQP